VATRRYEQRRRAEDAGKTRRRVIDAVFERLRAAPSEPVSIERIAAMAGVARSTIYAIFGSRAGLFDAVAVELRERHGFEKLEGVSFRPDAREAFRDGIRAATEMLAGDRDIYRALHSMAQLDQDAVGNAVRDAERNRAEAMGRIAHRLYEQGALHPGVTEEEAGHALWVLTSFESFDLLYTGRGLSVDAIVELLTATAERALMQPARPGSRARTGSR
jgi:AcrR family transcriptional regulator